MRVPSVTCLAMLCTVLWAGYASAATTRPLTDAEVSALVETMAADGFERAALQKIFKDQRVRYVPKLVRMLVVPPDFSASYDRFTKTAEIIRARAFKAAQAGALLAAGEKSGVDTDVIVAILLIETSLGRNTGRSPVLSVYASLLLENSLHREAFAQTLAGNPRKDHFLQRLGDKAAWARTQLGALITMKRNGGFDVCGLRGSYAGAFGIPQFLPTSYLKWASSGTAGSSPDLFSMPHAILSVANFLKEHGWKPSLTHDEKRAVIWHYNRSSVYVDTVLAVAAQLKGSTAHKGADQPLK